MTLPEAFLRWWLLVLLIPPDNHWEPGLSLALDAALQDLEALC